MQEPLKFPTSPRTQTTAEAPQEASHVQAIPEETSYEPVPRQSTEPELKAPSAPLEQREEHGSPDSDSSNEVDTATGSEEAAASLRSNLQEPPSPQPYSAKLREPYDLPAQKLSRFSTPFDTFKTPLLAVVTALSLVVAVWTYSVLEDTRSQLSTLSTAKASTDRALADAEAKLAAAEKAVANVKAALTGSPSTSSPEPSSKTPPRE